MIASCIYSKNLNMPPQGVKVLQQLNQFDYNRFFVYHKYQRLNIQERVDLTRNLRLEIHIRVNDEK